MSTLPDVLSAAAIDGFMRHGYVRVERAVPRSVVDACVDLVWDRLAQQGIRRDDRSTWVSPVVRVETPEEGPFVAAGTAPPLWEAYDQLIGPGAWWKRQGVGGTIPVRFPHESNSGDTGWHIETSFQGDDGTWRANVHSRGRALLALFLFTDVGSEDTPTRIRVGSHADVARVLAPAGAAGAAGDALAKRVTQASDHRPVATATGNAGDVYLCHPFLVHAASWPHRGTAPRMMAQPGVALLAPLPLTDRAAAYPVEAAILDAITN
jgi:hypothetical protein